MENKNLQQLNKKISFIVYYPYQWFIYKNIYNKIPSDKREVIVDLSIHMGAQDKGTKEDIISLLQKENVFFRVFEIRNRFNSSYFKRFFSNVEVIVSCWESGCILSEHTAHIKKVNTTYGLAKELTMLRPSRSIHDVILAYGKRDQKHFELLTKSIAIGNPRLDNFYSEVVDDSVREKLLAHFGGRKKKIVLYVPTHGDLGSFRQMLPIFDSLSNRYNIIFKPHYFSLREDRDIVERYRKIKSLLVIDDSWDTIEVMALSDIIVSDNSSAIFDAMQVDKPLIVCDFLDHQFLDVVHRKIRLIKRGLTGALTYSDSFEQEIKSKGLVATIKKPEDLREALEYAEEDDKQYKNCRREIVRDNFEYSDGRSAERAVEVILRIYNTERKHIPGILHHAYLAFSNRMHQWVAESEKKEVILDPLSNTTIVWIFCESHQNRDEILGTLYSVLNERGVSSVCVSGVAENDMIDVLSSGELSFKVRFFEHQKDALNFVYSQLEVLSNLLFVKANTHIRDLNAVFNFRMSCNRDMLFFFENIILDSKDKVSDLFYLLKYEILGFQNLSRNTLVFVPYNYIESIEKCAVLAKSSVLLGHDAPSSDNLSFDSIASFFIKVDSLKNQGRDSYGMICDDFALMPNFFANDSKSSSTDILRRLKEKGLALYSLGIPTREWPERKIGKFIFEIITGNFKYYQLLKLVLIKIFFVRKYVFLNKIHASLEQKLKDIKYD